ncbi:hypothetical protein [Solicola sp. PLA-1-18]|uniref:hypothetical protein n=1 Tax=Solicola sp. PLA-1-18 TaxID=3380532 RepID=UPI003B7F23BC
MTRDEQGSAIVEVTWLALILLVPLVYLLLAVFDLQRASYGVSAASRAAGRAFVLAPDQQTGYARAEKAADLALRDQGLGIGSGRVRVTCRPDPRRCLVPGSIVTVVVRTYQPLPLVPSVLGSGRPTIRVQSTHVEPYGTFREDRT